MNENLSKEMQNKSQQIRSALDTMENEIVRLKKLADESTGVIQKVRPYPLSEVLKMGIRGAGTPPYQSYGSNNPTPELARSKALAAYNASLSLVESNRTICAENDTIIKKILTLIRNTGIADKTSVYTKVGRKYQTVTTPAGWTQIGNGVATVDEWESLEKRYQTFLLDCDLWRKQLDLEEAKARQLEASKKAASALETKRIAACLKHGMDPLTTTGDDILDLVLQKNKYLNLAHYLQKNREDWHDGPDNAAFGLDSFTIDSALDRLIYDDIRHHVDDWDGDGRIFRDCEYNYDVLFGMVPVELMTEYSSALGLCSE